MEDIIREIKKYFDLNRSDNIACKNLWAEGEPLWFEMLSPKKTNKEPPSPRSTYPKVSDAEKIVPAIEINRIGNTEWRKYQWTGGRQRDDLI